VNLSSNGIGVPFNVQHTSHVSFDFQWSGEKNPEEIFELQDKLGQGYVDQGRGLASVLTV
jgi:hypothetical protein